MKNKSKVVEFVNMAISEAFCSVKFSQERSDHPGRDALRLAVEHGFYFEEDDIEVLLKPVSCRGGRGFGDLDDLYRVAVGMKNIRAAISIEQYLGRKPFIFVGVKSRIGHGRFSWERTQRIAVGSSFDWHCPKYKKYRVECTSFAKDQESLIACAYKWDEDGNQQIVKRFKITRKMLMDKRKESK
jgi:hypothetical protein